MNYVIAKIKTKEIIYEKLFSGEDIFSLPEELDNAIDYNPETILEDNEWFKINNFSETEYMLDILRGEFCTTDFSQAHKVYTDNIDYIMSYKEGKYCFQRILKHNVLNNMMIKIGESLKLDKTEKSIVLNTFPDAIYIKESDVLYFRKLSTISPIFKGIDELFREATDEEIKEFLGNDFIEASNGYDANKVKTANRKRIAMAMDTLKSFSQNDKIKILNYTHKYYPQLEYKSKERKFIIKDDNDMKHLLWGIEQRYYTTQVTKEKRVANSIVKL